MEASAIEGRSRRGLRRAPALAMTTTLGALCLCLLSADAARAEQCVAGQPAIWSLSGPGAPPTICLVTDTSQPLVTPATVQFRAPSEVSAREATLVEAGPPGGTSLWSKSLYTASEDGVRHVEVVVDLPSTLPCDPATGSGCTQYSYQATFAIPVFSPSGANRMTFSATKQRVTVTYRFEARKPLLAVAQLYLNAFPKGRTVIVTLRSKKKLISDLGSNTISVLLPRRIIERKCQPYGGCFVLGSGRSWLSEPGLPERAEDADKGTYSPRKRVYRAAGDSAKVR